MEPNKLEKDFKEKLEQRTIQPSDMAWDRLDAMLSVTENKKPKKNRTWMYMAASFLVFLLAGVLFLNQENESTGHDSNNESVVTIEEQPQTVTEKNEAIVVPVTEQDAMASQSTSPEHQHAGKSTVKNSGAAIKDKVKAAEAVKQEALAANDKTEPATILPVNNAQQLLASAVKQETSKKRSSVKVDPNSLLSAVEEELDDSFKDKVLIGTVRNFKAVQSAVANRNYQ